MRSNPTDRSSARWYRTFGGFERVNRYDVAAFRAQAKGNETFAEWYAAGNRGEIPSLAVRIWWAVKRFLALPGWRTWR